MSSPAPLSHPLSTDELRAALVGERVADVHYFTFDPSRPDDAPGAEGLRTVSSDAGWAAPHWRHPSFDCLEWGFELRLASRRVFSFLWPSLLPEDECTEVREIPFAATGIDLESHARWRVSKRSRWSPLIDAAILGVDGRVPTPTVGIGADGAPCTVPFAPRAPSPFLACHVLEFADRAVYVLGAEDREGGALGGMYDSVAVVFAPARTA